jgi:hypothetical protein
VPAPNPFPARARGGRTHTRSSWSYAAGTGAHPVPPVLVSHQCKPARRVRPHLAGLATRRAASEPLARRPGGARQRRRACAVGVRGRAAAKRACTC